MKQLLSADILDKKTSNISRAENRNLAKSEKLELNRKRQQVSLDKQIVKANSVHEKRHTILDKKLEVKLTKYDEIVNKIEDQRIKEKASIKFEALKENMKGYFHKRKENLDINYEVLNQNFELATQDLNNGIDKTVSYNTKVLVNSVKNKYDKMNFKLNWNEIKSEIINNNSNKKELKSELRNGLEDLYENSDKSYMPPSIGFRNFFENKGLQLSNWWLEVRKKWSRCGQWSFKEWINAKIWTVPVWMYAIFLILIGLGIGFDSMYAASHKDKHLITAEMMYPMAILLVVAIIGGTIFAKIPIWNKYFGGAVMGSLFVGAFLVYFGAIPKDGPVYKVIDHWFSKDNFLSMYISVLLVGAVILIPRKMIIKATGGFFLIIIVGSVVAMAFGWAGAFVTGVSTKSLIINYTLPILCDGNGGGIQPIAQIASEFGYDKDKWMSKAMAISTLASILSVIASAILNGLGKAKPSLSGDGQLIQRDIHTVERPVKVSDRNIATGLLLILMVYISSDYIAKLLTQDVIGVKVPNFAWMIIVCLLLNLCNLVPSEIKAGTQKVNTFISKQTTWLLMVGVGICNIELDVFFKALNGKALLISTLFIVGASVGPILIARLLRFNAIESAISAGLCMTAQGGSGAIACLGASNRMELMPYSQITCRIAGSVVLVFAAIAFSIYTPDISEVPKILL